jgi:hypothetical protein
VLCTEVLPGAVQGYYQLRTEWHDYRRQRLAGLLDEADARIPTATPPGTSSYASEPPPSGSEPASSGSPISTLDEATSDAAEEGDDDDDMFAPPRAAVGIALARRRMHVLEDCVICFTQMIQDVTGLLLPGETPVFEPVELATVFGARVTSELTPAVTHLVANGVTAKVSAALALPQRPAIIKPDWLFLSCWQFKRLPEDDFRLALPAAFSLRGEL